jgi:hypothetical protein
MPLLQYIILDTVYDGGEQPTLLALLRPGWLWIAL